jgi:hypothetical protein
MADFEETAKLIQADKEARNQTTRGTDVLHNINRRHQSSTAVLRRLSYTQADMADIGADDARQLAAGLIL